MESIVKIGDQEIRLKSTAASLLRYKAAFGRDGLRDLMTLAQGAESFDDENFDFDVFFRFFWVFAKSADPDIPAMEEWLDGLDVAPLDIMQDAFPQVVGLLTTTSATTVQAKKK